MAITDQISFTLLRFEWTPPDRLDVVGSWAGVDQGDLSQATLVLHVRSGTHRLEAVRGSFNSMRNWSAVFAWDGDPASIERAEVMLGRSLVVELPASNSKQTRRRFGRTSLTVRQVEQLEPPAGGLAADADVLAVHAALVAAQEEAAEARDELARMVTEAERTREQAKRERARRESDAARLHESMSTLRRLAEDSLQKEREATRAMSAQLDDAEASLAAHRTETAPLREQVQVAFAERDEAAEQVGVQRAEIERLGSKLDHLARDAREISERSRVETEQARAQLLEQERAAAASRAELEELRAAYDSARQEAARAGAKLASIEAESVAARAAQEEAEGLRDELVGARQEVERAHAETEPMRTKLNALREVFDQAV